MPDKPFGDYGCFIDGLEGQEGCVFDGVHGFTVNDCSEAVKLRAKNKGRNNCEFWQIVRTETTETVCPACGHHF